MRTKIYAYYGIQSCVIDLWEDGVPEEISNEVVKHLIKQDEKWVSDRSQRVFLDFTLSEAQEEWILLRSRREIDLSIPIPESTPAACLIRYMLAHPTDDVSETAHNCVMEVAVDEHPTKQTDEYSARISLKTVRKINR